MNSTTPTQTAIPPAKVEEAARIAAAVRDIVYRMLLLRLPAASVEQTRLFISNLALYRRATTPQEQNRVLARFLWLKVTPEIGETASGKYELPEIETEIANRFGDRLADVPGFYFDHRWRLNLPKGCALYGYKGATGFYNGILCQPLRTPDIFFLLSSAKFDGPKALRMEFRDRSFFEQYKESDLLANGDAPGRPYAAGKTTA